MISFLISLFSFSLGAFLCFFLPGNVFAPRKITLSFALGLVLWAWQGVFFGFLQLRQLTYVYLLVTTLIWLYQHRMWKFNFHLRISKSVFLPSLLIIFGVAVQLSSVAPMGLTTNNGLLFCCRNVPDALYHQALITNFARSFPISEPGMFGVLLHNYHYWADLVIGDFLRIFPQPPYPTLNVFFPSFFALLFGFLFLDFLRSQNLPVKMQSWILFFLYFSGDLIFLVSFLRGNKFFPLPGKTLDGPIDFLTGFPRILGFIAFFALATLLPSLFSRPTFKKSLLAAIVLSSLIGFKIYLFFFAALGLFFILLAKRNLKYFWFVVLAAGLSALAFFSLSASQGSFVWAGTWRLENFAVNPAFHLQAYEFKRLTLGRSLIGLKYEIPYFLLYIVANLGTLCLAFFQSRKSLQFFSTELNLFFLPAIVLTFIFGLFFLQNPGGANTVQFIIHDLIFLSLYCGIATSHFLSSLPKRLFIPMTIFIILLTVPRVLTELAENISQLKNHQGVLVSPQQLDAFSFIRSHTSPSALLATDTLGEGGEAYYFSVLTERPTYILGYRGILDSKNIDYEKRVYLNYRLFLSSDKRVVKENLKTSRIDYLYLSASANLAGENSFFQNVYDNGKYKLLKVRPDYENL